MDKINDGKENLKKKFKRRSSILKENIDDGEKLVVKSDSCTSKRRVSFADTTSIKEFLVIRDANTEWNFTYEEPLPSDSASSIEISNINNQTPLNQTKSTTFFNANTKEKSENPPKSVEETEDGTECIFNFLSGFLGTGSAAGSSSGNRSNENIQSNETGMEFTCNVNNLLTNSKNVVGCESLQTQRDLNNSMNLTLSHAQDISLDSESCSLNKSLFAHPNDISLDSDLCSPNKSLFIPSNNLHELNEIESRTSSYEPLMPPNAASCKASVPSLNEDEVLYSNTLHDEMEVTSCVTKANILKTFSHSSEIDQTNLNISTLEFTQAVNVAATDPILASSANLDDTDSEVFPQMLKFRSSVGSTLLANTNKDKNLDYDMNMTKPIMSKQTLNSLNLEPDEADMEVTAAVLCMTNNLCSDTKVKSLPGTFNKTDFGAIEPDTPSKIIYSDLDTCDFPMDTTALDANFNNSLNDSADPGKIFGLLTSRITNKEKLVNLSLFCDNPQKLNNSCDISDISLNISESKECREKNNCESFLISDKEIFTECSTIKNSHAGNKIVNETPTVMDNTKANVMEFTCDVNSLISNSERTENGKNLCSLTSEHQISFNTENDFNSRSKQLQTSYESAKNELKHASKNIDIAVNNPQINEDIEGHQSIRHEANFNAHSDRTEMEFTCGVSNLHSNSKVSNESVDLQVKNPLLFDDKLKTRKSENLTCNSILTNCISDVDLQMEKITEGHLECKSAFELNNLLGEKEIPNALEVQSEGNTNGNVKEYLFAENVPRISFDQSKTINYVMENEYDEMKNELKSQTADEEINKLESLTSDEEINKLESLTSDEEINKLESLTSDEEINKLESLTSDEEINKMASQNADEDLNEMENQDVDEEANEMESQDVDEEMKEIESRDVYEKVNNMESEDVDEEMKEMESRDVYEKVNNMESQNLDKSEMLNCRKTELHSELHKVNMKDSEGQTFTLIRESSKAHLEIKTDQAIEEVNAEVAHKVGDTIVGNDSEALNEKNIERDSEIIMRENVECNSANQALNSLDNHASHYFYPSVFPSSGEENREISGLDRSEVNNSKLNITKLKDQDILDNIKDKAEQSSFIGESITDMETSDVINFNANNFEEFLDDIDIDLVEDEGSNAEMQDYSEKPSDCLPNVACHDNLNGNFSRSRLEDSSSCRSNLLFSELNDGLINNNVNYSPIGGKHKLDDVNAVPEIEEKRSRLNDQIITSFNKKCDLHNRRNNDGSDLDKKSKSNSFTEHDIPVRKTEVHCNSEKQNMKCELCHHYLKSGNISRFLVQKSNDNVFHLQLKRNPFIIMLQLMVTQDCHQLIKESEWKPSLKDLKKPEARLAVKTFESCLNHHVEKLNGKRLCNVSNILSDIIFTYESMMSFLREIIVVTSTFLSNCNEDRFSVLVSNAKAHLMIDLNIKIEPKILDFSCEPIIHIEPVTRIGNLREKTIEDAIAAVDGKHKLLNKIKAVETVASNMVR